MKIGYGEDWTGSATFKLEIVAETTNGRYVCRTAPFEMTAVDGTKYMANSMGSLFLRAKDSIKNIHTETENAEYK